MVFQGEDVVLKKDIIKRERNFLPTESEWQARNADDIIIRSNLISGSTVDLFTVPANKTLFITSAWISGQAIKNANNASSFGIRLAGTGSFTRYFVGVWINAGEATHPPVIATSANNFNMPIKVESGEIVQIHKSLVTSTLQGAGGFTGWLEKKEISRL